MNKIEIDETMVEQDRINRFLNMIATEYGGNLATEYETYYISKCKRISELEKEIERLNNIIDGIETYCNIAIGMNFNMNNNELQNQIVEDYTKMLNKLEKLKGE